MIKRMIIIAAMIVVGLFAFVGCGDGGSKYNAEVTAMHYDDVGELLNGEFLSENRLGGLSSEKLTFVVDSERKFEDIFIVTPQEYGIDFENSMLIIYTCSAENIRQVSVKSVSYGSGNLKIKLQTKKPAQAGGDTCQPYQRYMFITLDKLEITTATVEYD